MAVIGFICARNTLTSLNVLFVVVAICLISAAVYAKSVAFATVVPVIAAGLGCGVFLLVVAVIGIFGTIQHHQVVLFFYALLLFIMFIAQLTVGCTCLGLRSQISGGVLRSAWEVASDELKAATQNEFQCCGYNAGSQNTLHGPDGHPLCDTPQLRNACCDERSNVTCCNGYTHIDSNQTVGDDADECRCSTCLQVIHPILDQAVVVIGVLCLCFSFAELVGAWLTIKYRNLKDPNVKANLFI